MNTSRVADFLADVVLTSHYLAEPSRQSTTHLNDAEMRALKIVHSIGPLSMHQLAEAMHTSKPRATQLVDLLESRLLITKIKGGDKRVTFVTVTKKGLQTVKELRKKYEALASAIETKLGKDDALKLNEYLKKVLPLNKLPID